MTNPIPHPFPYQGSKRKLASRILSYFPMDRAERLYEPFAGSAAVSLAAAFTRRAEEYIIGEQLEPLARLWSRIIEAPEEVAQGYSAHWHNQLGREREYYSEVRDRFNQAGAPEDLLYLLARCVKGAVRFNGRGEFNQSADNRRKGMHPDKVYRQLRGIAQVLRGRSRVVAGDFRETLADVTSRDVVYLDPPWQGTSGNRDSRYAFGLDMGALVVEIERLNILDVPVLLSFDGSLGERTYGEELPAELGMHRVALPAGRSSQATLLGRSEHTVESLYLSAPLLARLRPGQMKARAEQPMLVL